MSMLKIRVTDAKRPGEKTALVSIWSPSECLTSTIREGQSFEMLDTIASGLRWTELQITAGQRSCFRSITCATLPEHEHLARVYSPIATIEPETFKPMFNEFDTVGYVIAIEDQCHQKFQPAFVADADGNLLCVNFWIGAKDYAYDDVVRPGKFIAISHIEWRPTSQMKYSRIPQAYATSSTTFTEKPASSHLKSPFRGLRDAFESMADANGFVEQCRERIESAALVKSTATPGRSNNSFSSNAMPSPITPNPRSAITNTPTGVSSGGRSASLVQLKMKKLGHYPSPPPISPIVLKSTGNRRSLRNAFKSPLVDKNAHRE